MALMKSCLALGGIVLLLISGCFWLLSSCEAEYIADAPVEYAALNQGAQEILPPFAENIYSAVYADWQVGEWCFCFEIKAANEDALKDWCKKASAGRSPRQASGRPFHLTTPAWWAFSPDASLLCAVAGDLEHPLGFSAWYDATRNKVWFMYNR
ncbi:MAG: hypothetical protein IKW48_05620 [Akkermansia sp.]|nr:hypothetical protein [Akkermansia sp.]